MTSTVKVDDLRSFIPINSLSTDHLRELANKARRETVPTGRYVFKRGDVDKHHIYMLSGTVDLLNDKRLIKTIVGGEKETEQPLAHAQPRQFSARVKEDCDIIRLDSNLIDIMLTWDQTGNYHVEEIHTSIDDQDDDDWMTQMLHIKAFHKVPPANIQAIFMRMEPVSCDVGEVIIRQGDQGDYFYILKTGRVLVTRKTTSNSKDIKLAELGPGDSFGEEALISDTPRNATITTLSKASLVRLAKEDFISLLNEPLQDWVAYDQAKTAVVADQAVWLDVRLPSEFKTNHISGATNIPLISMRLKLKTLSKSHHYILYCDTGRRSSAAGFIMSGHGFQCRLLTGGLAAVPESDKIS